MNVALNPGAEKFIEDQIRAGRFRSASDLLEEAVTRMMVETEFVLDEQTEGAINRAEDQLDQGQGIDFEKFAADWRTNLASR